MKRLITTFISLFISFFILKSCKELTDEEPIPNVESPSSHTFQDLSFDYPSNWKITEESDDDGYRYIIIESPGTASACFHISGAELAEPSLLEEAISHNISVSEVDGYQIIGGTSQSDFKKLPDQNGFERLETEHSLTVLGEKFTYRQIFAHKISHNQQLFFVFETLTEDFQKVQAGFDLILNTFRIGEPNESSE